MSFPLTVNCRNLFPYFWVVEVRFVIDILPSIILLPLFKFLNLGVIEAFISSALLVTPTESILLAQQVVEKPNNSNKNITFDNVGIFFTFIPDWQLAGILTDSSGSCSASTPAIKNEPSGKKVQMNADYITGHGFLSKKNA